MGADVGIDTDGGAAVADAQPPDASAGSEDAQADDASAGSGDAQADDASAGPGDAQAPDASADSGTPPSDAWTLTNDQRRAFLYHYAPLLFIRAREGSGGRGRDWITNFDFDQDGDFSNNKDNWEDLDAFLDGERPSWDIRPTLYTGLVEFMTGARKDLVMLYHVYHAKQRGSIHDWERVEIRVNGVESLPGAGERVAYVVITEHSKHNSRLSSESDLNFLETGSGAHPMIWQAEGTVSGLFGLTGFYNGELHFVEDPWATIEGRGPRGAAEVDVNGGGDQDYQYLFVPGGDGEAVTRLGAEPIDLDNARRLTLDGDSVRFENVRRITYELQDLADIFPTHWEPAPSTARQWTTPRISVLLEEPLAAGIAGSEAVPAGLQSFLTESLDIEDDDESRNGYPKKHWFWGAYQMGDEGFTSAALDQGSPAGRRAAANGDPASLGAYFRQHDYFVHEGPDGSITGEPRGWLPAGWHTEAAGGFDGRWVQLFD